MSLLTRTKSLFPTLASDLFDGERFFSPSIFDFDGDLVRARVPSVNIRETDKDFQLELAAPGLERKDFKVEFENSILSISAEKEEEKEEKEKNYRRKEYSYNSFSRSFNLPENILSDKIDAQYENGILRIVLPKKEVTVSKQKKEIKVA